MAASRGRPKRSSGVPIPGHPFRPSRFRRSFLWGDADPLPPVELSREIAAGIASARLVVIDECGHGSTLEQPAAVNRQLVDWISDPS